MLVGSRIPVLEQVETARRALDYLCLTQIYLRDNVLLDRPLLPDDIEETPAGHWGTCPPSNAVLAALGPIRQHLAGIETLIVHGAGHAAAAARAHAWLTGTLGREDNALGQHPDGLRRLVAGFPRRDRFGGEITPLLPDVWYMGGQLGPALPVAHGMVLDAPHRLVVALVGDGELETGTAAAAWLGERALEHSGSHGRVLPVLMLNGLRMGGPSLLASLTRVELRRFFAGLGYRAIMTEDSGTTAVRTAIRDGLAGLRPLECGPSAVVVVTVPKGWGAPEMVGGRRIARTPTVHKTPLADPRRNPSEFAALTDWLASYRPGELFTSDAVPTPAVTRALGRTPAPHPRAPAAPRGCVAAADTVAKAVRGSGSGSGDAITDVLRDLHDAYGLRVFCPDELASNHIHLDGSGHDRQWVVEVLNEELCHLWAQGYQETGRRALVVSYEAFAPHVASLLAQHLSYRRLAATAGRQPMPSITYLLTSLGWHNTVSHANPALVDVLIAAQDPSVHVYTPADAARAAAAVATAVRKLGRCNLIITSKHPMPDYPLDTVESELRDGYAVWPHLSDDGRPDLVLVSAGDIPARELTSAVYAVRRVRPSAALRYVHVHDLTCLGGPAVRPAAIPDETFGELFPSDVPVLAAVPCHTAPVHAVLAERGAADRFTVRGWRNPDRPLPPPKLLEHTGLDTAGLTATALRLLGQQHLDPRSVTSHDLS
jgi:xylulose-5-phosphate/fructose-6-phosphate phosphoketolase